MTLGPIVAVDIETAGFTPARGFLLEVGLAFQVDDTLIGQTERLILPACKWPNHPLYVSSRKIHGIGPKELKERGLPEAEAAIQVHDLINRFAAKHGLPRFVAHKADFEARFLTADPWGIEFDFDTLEIARRVLPDLASHKLGDLATHLGLEWTGDAHRARPDAVMCARVLAALAALDARPAVEPLLTPVEEVVEPRATAVGCAGRVRYPAPAETSEATEVVEVVEVVEVEVEVVEPTPHVVEAQPTPPAPRDDADLADWLNGLRTLPVTVRQRLASATTSAPLGEGPDELLDMTFAGLRLLMLRGHPHDVPELDIEPLLSEVARRVLRASPPPGFAPAHRRAPTPNTAHLRLWAGEVLTPIGPATVGGRCIPGAVYRRPNGELIALTRDEIARLEVADASR